MSARKIAGTHEKSWNVERKPPRPGYLYVGTNGHGEVAMEHPDIDPDKDGVGHIIFSPAQARHLAALLVKHAKKAETEKP